MTCVQKQIILDVSPKTTLSRIRPKKNDLLGTPNQGCSESGCHHRRTRTVVRTVRIKKRLETARPTMRETTNLLIGEGVGPSFWDFFLVRN